MIGAKSRIYLPWFTVGADKRERQEKVKQIEHYNHLIPKRKHSFDINSINKN